MPTQIIERATPRKHLAASALLVRLFTALFALNAAPVAAQLALDVVSDASGTTVTAHTGYTANCSAQTASVSRQNSSAITPDVGFALANQPICAITRRMTQAHSESNVDAGQSKVTFWGGGYYNNDFDSEIFSVEFDGRLRTAYLGFDTRPRGNLLAGLMMSRNEIDVDYAFFDAGSRTAGGDYDAQVTSAHPYVNWNALDERLELQATVGYGEGELKIDEGDLLDAFTADVVLRTFGIGVSGSLLKSNNREVNMKVDVLSARIKVGSDHIGGAFLPGVKAYANRTRLMIEASRAHILTDGVQLIPSVDAGIRFDDRDGETGTGTEVGVKLRYTDPAFGLTVDFSGRTLIRHNRGAENFYDNYYNEWDFSIGGSLRPSAGADGEGLLFSVNPGYGEIIGGGEPTWQTLLDAAEKEPRMRARVGYGLPAFGGLLTPYSEIPLGGANKIYRLGAQWTLDSSLNLKLTGERQTQNNAAHKHAISLTGEMRF